MNRNPNRLLLVDDDDDVRSLISDVADELGFAVLATGSADAFLSAYHDFHPTLVMLDLVMSDVDGVELLRTLAKRHCAAKVMVMSGLDAKILKTAERLGASHGLQMIGAMQKPVELDTLERMLRSAWQEAGKITRNSLAAAIKADEMAVFYQPKVRLSADGSLPIDGVEALVRWQHPTLGLIPPDAFISLAEGSGLIGPLTDFVVRTAAGQVAAWRDAGLDLSVAINLAPKLLDDVELPDRISKQLTALGLTGDSVVLEVTESAAMGEGPNTTEVLTRFRLKEIGLSLDDFGTGYSSLVELYRMPFSELKVDRSFLADVDDSEEARIIIRSIVDLAKNLGLSVCAEGVETHSGLQYLRSIGCDKAQGYLVSRPIPETELTEFMGQWTGRIDPAVDTGASAASANPSRCLDTDNALEQAPSLASS